MKRVWMGAGLLAVLLVAGLLLGEVVMNRMEPGAETLQRAGTAARIGDWTQAETLTARIQGDWDRMKWFTAAVTGHEELEEIDSDFVKLSAYARRDGEEYQAICLDIAQSMIALAQNHACTWKNFF